MLPGTKLRRQGPPCFSLFQVLHNNQQNPAILFLFTDFAKTPPSLEIWSPRTNKSTAGTSVRQQGDGQHPLSFMFLQWLGLIKQSMQHEKMCSLALAGLPLTIVVCERNQINLPIYNFMAITNTVWNFFIECNFYGVWL